MDVWFEALNLKLLKSVRIHLSTPGHQRYGNLPTFDSESPIKGLF